MNYFNAHEEQTESSVPDKGTCETKRIKSVTKNDLRSSGTNVVPMAETDRKLCHVDSLEFTATS